MSHKTQPHLTSKDIQRDSAFYAADDVAAQPSKVLGLKNIVPEEKKENNKLLRPLGKIVCATSTVRRPDNFSQISELCLQRLNCFRDLYFSTILPANDADLSCFGNVVHFTHANLLG